MLGNNKYRQVPVKLRILILIMHLVILPLAFFAGYSSRLDFITARRLYDSYKAFATNILKNASEVDVLSYRIFFHNANLVISCFVPLLGTLNAIYSVYTTGTVLKAVSMIENVKISILFHALTSPVFWLEFLSISIASSESIVITILMIKNGFNKAAQEESGVFLGLILLSLSLLLLSATIEAIGILGAHIAF